MADVLTLRDLNRATLARQMLLARQRVGVVQAVEALCGMQAQEPKPPFLGLWSRVEDVTVDDLHGALHDRRLVRATAMRGTLHLLSAGDYTIFRPPLQPVLDAGLKVLGARAEGLELDKVLPVAQELLAERARTFNELRDLLQQRFPEVNERALGFAVRMCLPLAMVPTQDRWAFPRTAQFTLAEEWTGLTLRSETGPDGLVLRYLAAFGPASVADAQTWSGLRALGEVFERLRPVLVTFRDGKGRELFDLPGAPRPGGDVPAPARLLPEFDNLVLAHADRTRIVADEHRPALTTKNLRVRATFLWDGFVAGLWEAERKRKTATLRLRPFAPLGDDALTALTAEGEALLRFAEPDAAERSVVLGDPL